MRKINLLILLLSSFGYVKAQQAIDPAKQKMMDSVRRKMIDSIKAARIDQAALMYPRLRQFSITHQSNIVGNMNSRLYGNAFFKGRYSSSSTTINMNLPIIMGSKNIVVGSVGFIHQIFDLGEITNYDPQYSVRQNTRYVPMLNLNMSYTRRDTLFKIPFTATASIGGLFNPTFSSKQFRFLGVLTFPIIRKENSSLTAGLIVSIDPSNITPVIPLISYYHKFKSLNIDLMADLPYRIALRKPISRKMSMSVLTEISGNNSFINLDYPNLTLPYKMTYSSTEIKSGILMEYQLTKKAVLSMGGGINATLNSRIFEQGANQNDYFIKSKNSPTPYFQIGVSLLPFWAPFKK